ncbi:hypothetical protein Nepgr_019226 [Nepenthes gracilis]|uniref:PHD-type zinc finger plants domain-containing protein n=1 Tax=Nepenthes gracilis TaxID=150966 RepID=A0AAD3XV10_NEPGR|nr:hypothetical protein Nepgr_019226 [Nepenthes gracilis]
MTTSKAANFECCMCGDYGLSYELFSCEVCQFRSQHRYCSNLYPKAGSYRVCNWCLIDAADETSNTPNESPLPYKAGSGDDNRPNHGKRKKKTASGGDKRQKHVLRGQIKKQRPPEGSQAVCKKRIAAGNFGNNGCAAEERLLRRTKSVDITHGSGTSVTKPAFRCKARRYKLLDEVSG